MATEIPEMKEKLARLDSRDRADIASYLLSTLDDAHFQETLGELVEFDPEFQKELERRELEYRSDPSKSISSEEMFAVLEARYK